MEPITATTTGEFSFTALRPAVYQLALEGTLPDVRCEATTFELEATTLSGKPTPKGRYSYMAIGSPGPTDIEISGPDFEIRAGDMLYLMYTIVCR